MSLWQRYEEARANIQTGDIVLFSGKGGISSAIKWFTRSGWSHVGMALRVEEFDTVLLWESTTHRERAPDPRRPARYPFRTPDAL